MNIVNSFTARLNNSKRKSFNLDKKDKINDLKTNVIINNIAKTIEDNDPNFLNNKNDLKRRGRLYNKNNNNKNKKI